MSLARQSYVSHESVVKSNNYFIEKLMERIIRNILVETTTNIYTVGNKLLRALKIEH